MSLNAKRLCAAVALLLVLAVIPVGASAQAGPSPSDAFESASEVTSLPAAVQFRTSDFSTEPNEPISYCANNAGSPLSTGWFRYTPTTDVALTANFQNVDNNYWWVPALTIYRGTSLGNLASEGCQYWGNRLSFQAKAGTTYYFQVAWPSGTYAAAAFSLIETPPPTASFYYSPGDPTRYDSIFFQNATWDEYGFGVATCAWDFGDGTTGADCQQNHRYGRDGDYTVSLSVVTTDGRRAAVTNTVKVLTHDVAITKFTVPQSAGAGQTRHLVVGLNSKERAESVKVELYKSTPNGFQLVGMLMQSVPVRSANRTTDYDFSYTFNADDAAVGKVTFKAVATIVRTSSDPYWTLRDALPSDNEAIALPTKVAK